MSQINDENNYNETEEEQFKIEDIDEVHKSMIDSLEQSHKINNSKNEPIEDNINYNYISNENIEINNNSLKENKISIIDTENIIDSNILKVSNKYEESINNKDYQEGPINLIEFNRNNFVLNEKALDILNSNKEDLIIVSIVGKARTGKSYLMNLLLNNNQAKFPGNGFEISSKLNSCTRGIWLWDTPRQKPNSSSKIIFIDSEGTNSVDLSTKTYDSKIFALIVLISSLFIYNTHGNIDEKSIGDLALAAHLSNTVATNSLEDKDIIISELAPKFIWVLRDFVLDKIDPETGEEITSDEYLELCLRNKITNLGNKNKSSLENNLIRENIIKYFKERECITLPRPVDQEEDLHKLNEIPFSGLKSNFRDEFLHLKRIVYESSRVKKIGNKKVNGPMLVGLLKSFITSLNSKIIPNINTAIDNLIINDIEKSYDTCMKLWKENYIKIKEENYNMKDIYDIKYYIMNEYNNVLNENREIKLNQNFGEIFENNKKKLEKEIDNDIQKIKSMNIQKKNSVVNQILNDNRNVINFDSDFDYNNLEKNKKDLIFNSIEKNYSKFINDIRNNCDYVDEEKDLDLLLDKDKEFNNKGIKEIVKMINNEYKDKINQIEEQIKEDEFYYNTYDISKFNIINETLNQRYEFLSEELDLKEKEIFGLIGKYTKLIERKDKMYTNSPVKRGDPNIGTLRSQKFQSGICGITVETSEKGCGCELGNFCLIF